MKKLFLFVFGLTAILLFSCQKDEVSSVKKPGRLTVDIGLLIREYEANSGKKAAPLPDEFRVIVYRADGTAAVTFETASLMPDTIELEPGNYYVEALSSNDLPAAFENPYYYGLSATFPINSDMHQSVQVTCRPANTIVSVNFSDLTKSSFTDYTTTVSANQDSLVFNKDETRWGYFRPLSLTIRVELTSLNPDSSETIKSLTGKIENPLAGRHYEIYLNTTTDNGGAGISLLVDDTEIPVEIIEIGDITEVQLDTVLHPGDLIITEIMSDPSALSDTEGEWIEIYNNSGHTINLLNLVLQRDAINRHVINASIDLLPGEYYVLARTTAATNVVNSYFYGLAITLPNTGAVLSI